MATTRDMLRSLEAATELLGWGVLYALLDEVQAHPLHLYKNENAVSWTEVERSVKIGIAFGAKAEARPGYWRAQSCGGHWVSWENGEWATDEIPSARSWGDSPSISDTDEAVDNRPAAEIVAGRACRLRETEIRLVVSDSASPVR